MSKIKDYFWDVCEAEFARDRAADRQRELERELMSGFYATGLDPDSPADFLMGLPATRKADIFQGKTL